MNRPVILLLSFVCYLAACWLPAVNITEHGSSILSLTGWECLTFLPRILESLPGSFLLLLAWLANPLYLKSLYQGSRRHRSWRKALLLALSFLLYSLLTILGTTMRVKPGPGCILWYGSMAVLALLPPDEDEAGRGSLTIS
ncbi:MAG: hypothetical protein U0931_24665 [Vulcanimicrobiota bacterium]